MPLSKMGALIRVDPAQAREAILDAVRQSDGNRQKAASLLGLTHERSLYRWIERLRLWREVDALVGERRPGPPRTRQRILGAMLAAEGDRSRAARSLGCKRETLDRHISTLGMAPEIDRVLEHGSPLHPKPSANDAGIVVHEEPRGASREETTQVRARVAYDPEPNPEFEDDDDVQPIGSLA